MSVGLLTVGGRLVAVELLAFGLASPKRIGDGVLGCSTVYFAEVHMLERAREGTGSAPKAQAPLGRMVGAMVPPVG